MVRRPPGSTRTGPLCPCTPLFRSWLTGPTGQAFIAAVLSAAAILLVTWLIWLAMSSWVEYRLNPNLGRAVGARERTLLQLLRNAVTIVLATLALMLALSQLGVDIGPLLAGAGVLGLAVGFGAQTLAQDVIPGGFLPYELGQGTGRDK